VEKGAKEGSLRKGKKKGKVSPSRNTRIEAAYRRGETRKWHRQARIAKKKRRQDKKGKKKKKKPKSGDPAY